MHKHLRLIAILLTVFSLSSCKLCFKKPVVEKIQDIKVLSVSPDKTELAVSLIVHNPNKYSIQLRKLNLEMLDKNRIKVGQASLNKELEIPQGKSINLDFKVLLETRPIVKMVSSINQDLHFFITGYGEGKALGFSKDFAFEEPYSLSIKEHLEGLMPKFSAKGQDLFKVQRSYVGELALAKSNLNTDFILLNPYGFTYTFKGFPSEIYVDGKEVGKGNLRNQLSFNEDVYYREGTMVFQLSNLKSVLGAVKGVFKGEIAYTVKGRVLIEAFGMDIVHPYEFSGSIPVSLWELLLK